MMQTGDVQLLHAVLRMPASGSVLAQADTLLGIVVKAEQLLKRQKAEASTI